MTLQLYFRTDALLFFLSFNVFGKMGKLFRQNHRLLARGGEPATPGRSWSRQSFTDSSYDYNSNHNGRRRPTPTPVSTPTPQPCFTHHHHHHHHAISLPKMTIRLTFLCRKVKVGNGLESKLHLMFMIGILFGTIW